MRGSKIRSVGAGFFHDDDVATMTAYARLLLAALPCFADDQGVFRWKPIALRAQIFPVDNVDMAQLLSELESKDLIRKFAADGGEYGAIRGFGRHQKPRDARASFPLPEELDEYVRVDEVPVPRQRSDRPEVVWPLRPRAVRTPSTPCPVDSPGTARGGPETAHVEWSGVDGSGGEVTPPVADVGVVDIPEADPPAPKPQPKPPVSQDGFAPPPWIPEDWLNGQVQKAEGLCSTEGKLSKVTHATLMRALRLACIQFAGDPPKGWDAPGSTLWRAQLSHKRVAAQAAQWIRDKAQQRQAGKGTIQAYIRACAEHGPDEDVWLPEGTAPRREAS